MQEIGSIRVSPGAMKALVRFFNRGYLPIALNPTAKARAVAFYLRRASRR